MNHIFKFVLAVALCAAPAVAVACSCAPPPAPKIALQKSAAVFVGRVTANKKGDSSNTYQFAVSKQWKGITGDTASVESESNSAACGIDFDENRDYLVYAYKNDGESQLRTNLCSRTARAADAAADLAELGAPVTANPAQTATYPTDNKGVVQIKAVKSQRPLEVLAQALQNNKNARLLRVNWLTHPNSNFRGTALYDREKSTLKVYAHSHTISQIPPRTIITSALYLGVTPQLVQQLGQNPHGAGFFTGFLNFGLLPSSVLTKYGVTAQDLGSKQIND